MADQQNSIWDFLFGRGALQKAANGPQTPSPQQPASDDTMKALQAAIAANPNNQRSSGEMLQTGNSIQNPNLNSSKAAIRKSSSEMIQNAIRAQQGIAGAHEDLQNSAQHDLNIRHLYKEPFVSEPDPAALKVLASPSNTKKAATKKKLAVKPAN